MSTPGAQLALTRPDSLYDDLTEMCKYIPRLAVLASNELTQVDGADVVMESPISSVCAILPAMLDVNRIAALLRPFADVSDELASRLRIYLDLLLRWNARINLTAIRDPEQIVTRHFGESLFAARILCDAGAFKSGAGRTPTLSDIGSGAGFPGIPIKLVAPEVHVTLIESQNKKATFLRQVIRTLDLKGIDVFSYRAETWTHTAQVVTFRAVEKFEQTLSLAATLVAPTGTLCLLIGKEQVPSAEAVLAPRWHFREPVATPSSRGRMVLVGIRGQLSEV